MTTQAQWARRRARRDRDRGLDLPSEDRSSRLEVRNPVLGLPSAQAIQELPAEQRRPLGRLLRELAADADRRAEECWAARKGALAAYWRTVSTYAKHTARAIDPADRRAR